MNYVQDENGVWRYIPDQDGMPGQELGQSIYGDVSPLEDLITQKATTRPSFIKTPAWAQQPKKESPGKGSLIQARKEGFSSLAEKELVIKASDEKKSYADLNWWRGDGEYVDWLRGVAGWDPDSTPDWMGNKKYIDYIKYKAENPSGLGAFSKSAAEAMGSVIMEISNLVKGVPIIGKVAKPMGSVFKFIGNLIDMPMNMVRGTISAFGSGHPEEILENIWDGMKHGVSAGTEGRYHSFADAGLRNLIDKYKQGMTDGEYKKFIDSDDYRKTKRFWQMGGLLADMVLDPMWLMGAGEAKVMNSFRAVKGIKGEIAQLIKANYTKGGLNTITQYWKAFEKKGSQFVDALAKDANAMQDFGLSYDLLKKFKNAPSELSKQNQLSNIVDTAISSFNQNIKKFDAYGSRIRLYKPFTKHEAVLLDTPIRLEPAKRYLSRFFGGEARQNLRQANRILEFYENKWKLTDTAHHALMAKANDNIGQLEVMMKKINPNFTKENANELFFEMMESSKVDKQGKVYSNVIGDQPGYKVVGGIATVDPSIIKELDKMPTKDFTRMVGTELTDHAGKTHLITDYRGYVKELLQPFAKLNGKMYPQYKNIMNDMVLDWHKQSKDLLKIETGLKQDLYKFLVDEGYAHQFNNFVSIIDESRRSRRVWGINSISDIKSGELVHEYISYMPHRLTDQARNYLSKVEKMEGDGVRSHLSQMFYQSERLQYVPTDFTNDVFLKTIFDKNQAKTWIDKIKSGKMTAPMGEKLRRESMARIRQLFKKRNEKESADIIRDLTNKNLHGAPYDFNDMGVVKYAGPDFMLQPLIQRMDAVTINKMSRQGKIFQNFKDDIFQIDPTVMTDRIEATHKLIGAVEANIFGLKRGVTEGWLKRKNIYAKKKVVELPKPVEKYLGVSDWASGDGIFAGHWVPEMFKDNMDALSKGILKYTEPPDLIKIDKLLQTKPFETLKKFNQWWKVQVTMKHPAFHARNFFSNRIVMLGEGRSPHYAVPGFMDDITKDALLLQTYNTLLENRSRLLKAGKDATKVDKRISQLSGRKVNMGDFGHDVPIQVAMDQLVKQGVMSNGLTWDIIGRAQQKTGMSNLAKDKSILQRVLTPETGMPKWVADYNFIFGSKDKWTAAGTKAASFIEVGLGRNELFFHLIRKKGFTIEDAARRVNKVLVDYGAISRGEKILKDHLLPFYTWQSRMIGVMLEKAVTQPIMFNKLTQLQNNMYKMLELDKAFSPKYEKTGEGLPILLGLSEWNKFVTGKPMAEIDTKYITAERFLPQTVVNLVDMDGYKDILNPLKFTQKTIEGFLSYAIGNMTPFLKTPVEQLIDYSFYFKRPITRYADQTVKYAGIKMSAKVQNVLRSFIGGMKEVDEIVGWFDKNAYTGKPYHTVDTTMFSWLLGGKAYDRNEIREIQFTLGALKDQYRYNARDAKNKVHDPAGMKKHARQAVALKYAINILEWYKNYATEFKDKELYGKMKDEGQIK